MTQKTVLDSEELAALIRLNRVAAAKVAREALVLFQQGFKPRETCERLIQAGLLAEDKLFPGQEAFDPSRELESAASEGIRMMTWFDESYPESLRAIENAPLLLYVRGTLSSQDAAAVAVVGSREPSFYGAEQASRFARELAAAGVTVVSGLARGIDQAAHQGCLAVPHGRTFAVLGSGLDRVYPRENQKLFEAICERGAVISEFPLGTEPLAWNFPRRNRIISGLSLGVLVVEAHVRSGSLITARLAAEQGRQVFAVPGPVDQWTSRGAHQLLREGAVLAESAQDILQDLAPVLKDHAKPTAVRLVEEAGETHKSQSEESRNLTDSADCLDEVLKALLREGPRRAEELLQNPGYSAGTVLALLSRLELTGEIQKTARGEFRWVGSRA